MRFLQSESGLRYIDRFAEWYARPGGILSTGFNNRSGAEAKQVCTLPDYEVFARHTGEVYSSLAANSLATEEEVAQIIYDAATDGSDRLRYVATEDIKPLTKARRETSEDKYITFMRTSFGFKT